MSATEEHTNMEDDQSQVVFVLETQLEFWQKIDAIRLYGFSTIYEGNYSYRRRADFQSGETNLQK